MTLHSIFLGNAKNDGLGDSLRNALGKINNNFQVMSESVTPSYMAMAWPMPLDLTVTNAAFHGFDSGCTDGQFGYLVNSTHIVRFDLHDYSTVGSFDLSVVGGDGGLGYTGCCSNGRYLYVIYGKMFVTLDLSDFSTWTASDVTVDVDETITDFWGMFLDSQWAYLVPYENSGGYYGKLVRVRLIGGYAVSVFDLATVDPDLVGFRGGVTDGEYGYLFPMAEGGDGGCKLVRVALADIGVKSASDVVDILDLTLDVGTAYAGFSGGFVVGNFLYCIPSGHQRIFKIDLDAFIVSGTLDLAVHDPGQSQYWGGFASGRYGFVCPDGGKLIRFDLRDFSTVVVLDMTVENSEWLRFHAGFVTGENAYLVPSAGTGDLGTVLRLYLGSEDFGSSAEMQLSSTAGDFEVGYEGSISLGSAYKGVWEGAVVYKKGDAVAQSGMLYISDLDDNIGNSPADSPSWWKSITEKGATGEPGGFRVPHSTAVIDGDGVLHFDLSEAFSFDVLLDKNVNEITFSGWLEANKVKVDVRLTQGSTPYSINFGEIFIQEAKPPDLSKPNAVTLLRFESVGGAEVDCVVRGTEMASVATGLWVGLVAYYACGEPSWSGANDVVDSSFNAYNASPVGATDTADGGDFIAVGNRVAVNTAVGDGIDLPSEVKLTTITRNHTFALWVKPTSLGSYQYLYAQKQSSGAPTEMYIRIKTDGKVMAVSYVGGVGYIYTITTSSAVTAGAWSHVIHTIDNDTGMVKLYINGVEGASASFTPTLNAGADSVNAGLLTQRSQNTIHGSSLIGEADQMAFWDYVFDQDDVDSLYNSGQGHDINEGA
ncbi:MAG: LamG domain-containing protein [Magnetococcales bacterium]|nr:LamG domain-containing protein [Magnetococcales bacterium]